MRNLNSRISSGPQIFLEWLLCIIEPGANCLSFTQHLFDEISSSLENSEQFLADFVLHKSTPPSLHYDPLKAFIEMSGSGRCTGYCMFIISVSISVLSS